VPTDNTIYQISTFEDQKFNQESNISSIDLGICEDTLKDYSTYGYKLDGERFDCGSVLGYLKANIAFALLNQNIKPDVENLIKEFYSKISKD